eukprot:NODE_296_length_11478_cov_0.345197.p6 type:complete len:235 gc:universal NODE_296_length_11478_cov_0.345197:2748-2044(-)
MNEQLDVIQSMYIEAEREGSVLVIPVNRYFKLYLEVLQENKIDAAILPCENNVANVKVIQSNVNKIIKDVTELYQDNYLYDLIENVSSYLNTVVIELKKDSTTKRPLQIESRLTVIPKFVSSSKLTVKKSTFIAHVCRLLVEQELGVFISQIHQIYPDATHHTLAYCLDRNDSDYDDDGEIGAGQRVLFMMKSNNLKNCAIIVSRWFGGIKLGPGRYKVITNLARELLLSEKWI